MKLHRPSDAFMNRAVKVCDSIASAACLVFVLKAITQTADSSSIIANYFIIYILLAVSKLMQALSARKSDRMVFIKNLCYAGAFAAASVLPFIFDMSYHLLATLFAVYLLVIAANRVLSIIRNHKPRNVVFNVLLTIFIVYLTLSLYFVHEKDYAIILLFHLVVIASAALGHIIVISFSQMRFGVLKKILRKTYAAEILFGLVLLMISFSFVFSALESGIPSFTDALWYCFSVVTTIGFGDYTVVSLASRVLTVILGIYGIVVVALITSVIVNFYNEVKHEDEKPDEPQPAQVEEKSADENITE
ncbi:MAG: two pore domain potassium channel family protein [Clostridia bacterium]|nr:two pore domain potassium channel family protein [Clostridia bacterium]